ncbi:hypothetical protein Glove_255g19 [Diversispora epigaea]|uniref:Uncharacterized protein n=1 Tax=Diversispora epigaea TaxID=1348612 RepID=A0A397I814_9GLOM|nr:hypothetical protein Glove_255g19 [Diversispora epigaea]
MYKGSFSFKNDKINSIEIDQKTNAKIERKDDDTAELYFVNDKNFRIPIPADIILQNTTDNEDQVPPSSADKFHVTWHSNYTLYKKGHAIFHLENQKQHAIRLAATIIRRVIRK